MEKSRNNVESIKRLYRQATIDSQKLLLSLRRNRAPYRHAIKRIAGADTILINNLEGSRAWLKTINEYVLEMCSKTNPLTGIPTLFQTINDYYYPQTLPPTEPEWLGMPLKAALSIVAGNVFTEKNKDTSKTVSSVHDAVLAVGLLEQMKAFNGFFELFPEGNDYIKISGVGVVEQSNHVVEFQQQLTRAYESRGLSHRTLEDCSNAIWQHMGDALKAVENVLNGRPPQDQKPFVNTLFAQIPHNSNPDFWRGIWARIIAAVGAIRNNNSGGISLHGISLLERRAVSSLPEHALAEHYALESISWNQKWYVSRVSEAAENMILERPLVNINLETSLYATTFLTISDSLNWFVERSILPYPTPGGVKLPEKLFEKLVSQPFEDRINKLFRKHGFVAGAVTNKGIWQTQNGHINLGHKAASPIPGQIDSVAFHRGIGLVIVSECKVLSYPHSLNRMRNLLLTIGDSDAEALHGKLQDKVRWIASIDYFSSSLDLQVLAALILDRFMPGMMLKNQHLALTSEMLEDLLKAVLRDAEK